MYIVFVCGASERVDRETHIIIVIYCSAVYQQVEWVYVVLDTRGLAADAIEPCKLLNVDVTRAINRIKRFA